MEKLILLSKRLDIFYQKDLFKIKPKTSVKATKYPSSHSAEERNIAMITGTWCHASSQEDRMENIRQHQTCDV